MIISIDAGASAFKIVGLRDEEACYALYARKDVRDVEEALQLFLASHALHRTSVSQIALVGIGAGMIDTEIDGLPTTRIHEFEANTCGVQALYSFDKCVIVSIGTGTSFLRLQDGVFEHLGGVGMGGGTVVGLMRSLLGVTCFEDFLKLAGAGKLELVDWQIRDFTNDSFVGLPLEATVSNLGKADTGTRPEDLAVGILNMVLQTVACTAYLTGKRDDVKDIVCIGQLAGLPFSRILFGWMSDYYQVKYHIPTRAAFITALGAALCLTHSHNIYHPHSSFFL